MSVIHWKAWKSRIISATMGTLLAIAATLAGTTPAHADVLDVTCTPPSSNVGTYNPPLSLTPQDVTVSTNIILAPCVSLSTPGLTSGISTAMFPAQDRTCAELLGSGTNTMTITWNTGQTSTIFANYNATIVGGLYTITATGVVTSGLFAGDTVVRNFTGPATDILLCLAGLATVSKINTVGTLEITSLT